jgi:4-alpha-glucanotransferase
MIAATLEDALAVEERPNIPGTTGAQRANWSIALPALLEAIETNPLAASIGRILDRRRRIAHRSRGSREG